MSSLYHNLLVKSFAGIVFILVIIMALVSILRSCFKSTQNASPTVVATLVVTAEMPTPVPATQTPQLLPTFEKAMLTETIEIPTPILPTEEPTNSLVSSATVEPTRRCDEPYLDWQKYVVHSGDNFDRLMDFQPKNIGEEAILSVNYCIKDTSFIQVGQILWFPNLPSTPSPTPVFSSTPTSPPLVTTPPSVSTPTVTDPVPTPTPTEKPQPPTPEP